MKYVVIIEKSDENMRGTFFPDISRSLLNPYEDLNKCAAAGNVRRLRPFVLLVRSTCRWR
jgi:hypothetical protein